MRRRQFLSVTLAAACAALPLRLAGAAPVTVRHAQGETTIPAVPNRVVVFDLAALDILDALGVPVAGVPSGPKPDYLRAYDGDAYPKVGSMFEPDYEAIHALAPDLIIVGTRTAPRLEDLRRLAPTIDLSIDPTRQYAGVATSARVLGRIFGKEAAVEDHLRALEAKRAQVRTATAPAGPGLFVMTTGGRLSAYGPGSRFDILYDEFGITPAVARLDKGTHGQAISHEFLLQTNPDWLFVLDRDATVGRSGESARALLDTPLVHGTTAWKRDQIVYLDGASWYLSGGGLTALDRSMEDILRAMGRA